MLEESPHGPPNAATPSCGGGQGGVSGYNSKTEADEAVAVASLMPIAKGSSACTRGEWLGREYLRQ